MSTKDRPQSEPSYVALDPVRRDEFISGVGSFTPNERKLFHSLCDAWKPRIPYRRFAQSISVHGADVEAELTRLGRKLRQARIGLITTRFSDGKRRPDAIVLTGEGDSRFYAHLVNELFQEAREDPVNPLPLVSTFQQRETPVPEGYTTNVPRTELVRLFTEQEPAIFRVDTLERDALLVTTERVHPFIALAISRIRHALENRKLLTGVARIMGTSLTELQERIKGRDPRFWYTLTRQVLHHREELEAQRGIPVKHEFFQTADLLLAFVDAQLEELKLRKAAEQERYRDLDAVARHIADHRPPLVPQSRADQILGQYRDKYGESFEEFRSRFYYEYAEAPSGSTRKLPTVVPVKNGLIHRTNLFPVFLDRMDQLRTVLYERYAKMMQQHIRAGARNRKTAFLSRATFAAAMAETAEELDPVFTELYEQPSLMAEALLHWAKQQKSLRATEDLRKLLERYFVLGGNCFYDLPRLLGLPLVSLFDAAFTQLNPFRQLLYRFSGRYAVMREHFLEESRKDGSLGADGQPEPGPLTDRGRRNRRFSRPLQPGSGNAGAVRARNRAEHGEASEPETVGPRGAGRRSAGVASRFAAAAEKSGKGRRPGTPAEAEHRWTAPSHPAPSSQSVTRVSRKERPISYTKRDRERAWKEFGERIQEAPPPE